MDEYEKETVSDGEIVEESEKDTEESIASVTGEPSAREEEVIETNETEYFEDNEEAVSDDAARADAAQAIFTKANNTLTFYYGPEVYTGDTFNGKRVDDVWSGSDVTDSGSKDPKWINTVKSYTKYVVFDTSFLAVKPSSTYAWFSGLYQLLSVDVSGFDTSNVTDMYRMFTYCSGLTSLDVSSFDVSHVTSFDQMFNECSSLRTIYCKDSSTNWENDKDEILFGSCTALVGTAGDTRVRFNSGQTGSSMAKSANLGGYFTPKVIDFFIPGVDTNRFVNEDIHFTISDQDLKNKLYKSTHSISDKLNMRRHLNDTALHAVCHGVALSMCYGNQGLVDFNRYRTGRRIIGEWETRIILMLTALL